MKQYFDLLGRKIDLGFLIGSVLFWGSLYGGSWVFGTLNVVFWLQVPLFLTFLILWVVGLVLAAERLGHQIKNLRK